MNVLLVHLNPAGATFQLGLSYIAAMLRAKKHEISFLFLSKLDKKAIFRQISQARPQIILISVASDSFELSKQLIAYLDKKNDIPVVLGGIHPTLRPDECLSLPGVLGICVGEGEYPVLELIESIQQAGDYSNIRNLWVRSNGAVNKNDIRPLIRDLDELPLPDYQIFGRYYQDFQTIPVILSRGCPFNCSYCCNHALRRLYRNKGNYLRQHSVGYSMDLIQHLARQFPEIKNIEFFDDTFISDKKWLYNFLPEFSRLGLRFICNARFDLLNEELVKFLAACGCIKINVAVECGNEQIRKEVLRRPISNKEIIEKAGLLKKYKIALFTHNMLGIPYETEADIVKTIELNRAIKPDTMQASIFNPYPSCDLTDLCLKNNWVNHKLKTKSFHDFTVLNTPYIKPHLVDYYFIIFESMVYERGIYLKLKRFLYWLLHFRHNRIYLFLRSLRPKILALPIKKCSSNNSETLFKRGTYARVC